MRERIDNCPHCKVSLIGEPIPEADREVFGSATHFRREIGIYSLEEDRCVHNQCPDCGKVITNEQLWGKA